jgi:undecaprenyl diphosphate synthase
MSQEIDTLPIPKELLPRHVAIIMDGNGRWAEARQKPRLEGHREGARVVRDITTFCRELGISYLTLYSFSVQNWQRPLDEIQGLMNLLEEYCVKERDTLMKNCIRLRTIGDTSRLPQSTQHALGNLMEETQHNDQMTLSLALNYGGREELITAMRRLGEDINEGRRNPSELDDELISSYLYTHEYPDPDLVIRTSGETRISNFLLWQIAYAELYFTDTLWPDFDRAQFSIALQSFASRLRRYGGLTDLTGSLTRRAVSC